MRFEKKVSIVTSRPFRSPSFIAVCVSDPPSGLELGIYGEAEVQVKPNTALSFTCHINQGLAVILDYKLEWIHVSLADPSNPVETMLTSQQTLLDSAPPESYVVDVKYDTTSLNITLTVKDGEESLSYICTIQYII